MAIDNTVWGATPPTVRACVETMWNRGRAPVSGSTTKLKQYATVRPARISIASPHQHQHFHLSIVEILTRLLCNHNYQRRGQKRGRMLKNTHNVGDREKMAKLKKIIIKKKGRTIRIRHGPAANQMVSESTCRRIEHDSHDHKRFKFLKGENVPNVFPVHTGRG